MEEIQNHPMTLRSTPNRTPGKSSRQTPLQSPAVKRLTESAKKRIGVENWTPSFKKNRVIIRRTRRPVQDDPLPLTAPVLWKADAGSGISALHVDVNHILLATNEAKVITLDLFGKVLRTQQLPIPVGSFLKNGRLMYAWCPAKYGFQKWKGALLDITNLTPRVLFDVEDIGESVQHATMQHGLLIIGDDQGSLFALGANGEIEWQTGTPDGAGKVLLSDETGVYWGHRKKFAKYSIDDGLVLWEYEVTGRFASVLSAAQDKDCVYVEAGGHVVQLSKEDGTVKRDYIPARHRASNVCVGNNMLITGSCPTVLFNLETAQEKYRMNFSGRLNDAFLKLHESGRLFTAWDGLYCIDVSPEGIQRAVDGKSTRTLELNIDEEVTTLCAYRDGVASTEDETGGVVLFCESTAEDEIKVIPLGDGYIRDWCVRFPKNLQRAGARFVVDGLIPNEKHCFYSIEGDIRRVKSGDSDEDEEINGNDELINNNLDMSVDGAQSINNENRDMDISINADN